MTEALLIVHLSSLDAYVWDCGLDAGTMLSDSLRRTIADCAGPIVVVDSGRAVIGRDSRPRARVLERLRQKQERVIWFAHDGETEAWDEPMQRLGHLLRALGITDLRIGGVWATENGSHGCVNETMRHLLGQGFICRLDVAISGFEELDV